MSKNILKQIADILDNSNYDDFVSVSGKVKEAINLAAENDAVIVYGMSDDLVEFDGAFQEEAGCYGGGVVTFDEYGTSDDGYEHANKLQVRWMKDFDDNNYLISFSYCIGIPHETFMVYDEGYPYCRGLVFFMDDMKSPEDHL